MPVWPSRQTVSANSSPGQSREAAARREHFVQADRTDRGFVSGIKARLRGGIFCKEFLTMRTLHNDMSIVIRSLTVAARF